ncbi:MAG TPA: glycosyltransferase family 2 protein [Solirubrobacterales bacterium]|nr:glycosyltransferase family 2 protein [Solirubrobacterales bacterium]
MQPYLPEDDAVSAAIYIPNFNGERWLPRTLQSLRGQTERLDVVVVDNGSSDGSAAAARADFPEVTVMELGENVGFGPALNRAVAAHPAEAIVLLNNDVECEPGFCAALLAALDDGVEMVAGVLLKEREPGLIDSAGVVADHTLMGFDFMQGEPVAALAGAPDPLGPTGGAGLYRRAAWEAVGGFDERIFLYYEDLDLALRIGAGGGRCRLAADARALHAYSASLGAGSGAKYARTGWSRGYMLRRYGVMRDPALAARALACEGAIVAGQMLRDRTAAGLSGRLRGFRAGTGPHREVGAAPLLEISAREALALRRRRRA